MIRNRTIDIAKGLATLMVLIHHNTVIDKSNYLLSSYTMFFMPVFFVCYGYVYDDSKRSKKDAIGKRSRDLLYPYVIYQVIYSIYAIISERGWGDGPVKLIGMLYGRERILVSEPANIFYRIGNGPSWFLLTMFLSTIVLILLYNKYQKHPMTTVTLLIAGTILLCRLPILLPWGLDVALCGTIFMLWGKEIHNRNLVENNNAILGIIIYMLAWYLNLKIFNGECDMSSRYFGGVLFGEIIFCVLGCISSLGGLIIAHALDHSRLGYLLSEIGKKSIYIYILHALVFKIISNHLAIGIDIKKYQLVILVVECLAAVILGVYISNIWEKFKMVKEKFEIR